MAEAMRTASQPSSIAKRGIAGGPDAGVEDDRDTGLFHDHRDVVRIADAQAGADRGAERHDRRAARSLKVAGETGSSLV